MTKYLFPTSIEDAVQRLTAHKGEAQIVAGGTDVMAEIRQGKIRPRCLVDITRIPDLDRIEVGETFVKVGAAVTFARIKDSPFLKQQVHVLVDAARCVGAIGIQNAATWVGNVVQGMPAADGAITALALETEARVVDAHGAGWYVVESLCKGPGVSAIDPKYQLVTHMRFPWPSSLTLGSVSTAEGWGTAWKRVGRRASLVLPILNCAVKLCLNPSDLISRAIIALGPVAPRPFRAREAEMFLIGRRPTAEVLAEAARLAQEASSPRSSIHRASKGYRLAVIPPLVSDALITAYERAKSRVVTV
jgi:carbon-monoxide dehydrogenase medium subunit